MWIFDMVIKYKLSVILSLLNIVLLIFECSECNNIYKIINTCLIMAIH